MVNDAHLKVLAVDLHNLGIKEALDPSECIKWIEIAHVENDARPSHDLNDFVERIAAITGNPSVTHGAFLRVLACALSINDIHYGLFLDTAWKYIGRHGQMAFERLAEFYKSIPKHTSSLNQKRPLFHRYLLSAALQDNSVVRERNLRMAIEFAANRTDKERIYADLLTYNQVATKAARDISAIYSEYAGRKCTLRSLDDVSLAELYAFIPNPNSLALHFTSLLERVVLAHIYPRREESKAYVSRDVAVAVFDLFHHVEKIVKPDAIIEILNRNICDSSEDFITYREHPYNHEDIQRLMFLIKKLNTIGIDWKIHACNKARGVFEHLIGTSRNDLAQIVRIITWQTIPERDRFIFLSLMCMEDPQTIIEALPNNSSVLPIIYKATNSRAILHHMSRSLRCDVFGNELEL